MKLVTLNNYSAIIACHQGQFHTPNVNSTLDMAIKRERSVRIRAAVPGFEVCKRHYQQNARTHNILQV